MDRNRLIASVSIPGTPLNQASSYEDPTASRDPSESLIESSQSQEGKRQPIYSESTVRVPTRSTSTEGGERRRVHVQGENLPVSFQMIS
ncbi:hypothetical protein chiPu_0025065 [Chiloscyllium punctatum]|uniref:Uncharacterized protein n=1 Tax=Chiloscyllium punctatum TaxID=137246 RepID=A0A401TEZ3_CHIPU|nr:hypothetical protein [Chiloscyllium punctatum]